MINANLLTKNEFAAYIKQLERRLTSLETNIGIDEGGGSVAIAITTTSPLANASNVISLAGLTTLGTANYIPGVNAAGTAWEYKDITSPLTKGVALGLAGLTNLGTANYLIGANAAANAWEYKQLLGTANRVTVTHAAGSVTWSGPQDIHTGASPIFVTVKCSGLTDGYLPYHVADATGLANSPIQTNGLRVGIGRAPTDGIDLDVNGAMYVRNTFTVKAGAGNDVGVLTYTGTDSGVFTLYKGGLGKIVFNTAAVSFLETGYAFLIGCSAAIGSELLRVDGNVYIDHSIVSGAWHATTIAADHGGTGQSVYVIGDFLYATAIDALSMLAPNATATKKYLSMTSSVPSWATILAADLPTHQLDGAIHTVSGLNPGDVLTVLTATTFGFAGIGAWVAHDLLSATHGDTTAAAVVRGDMIIGVGATPKWTRLADVAAGSYFRSGGVGLEPLWSTLILPNAATAFRLPVATAANTIGELAAVGATGEYLAGVTGAIPAWAILNQAAVDGLKTTQGPSFAHIHATDAPATGGALITAAESWIGPSATAGIYFRNGNVCIGAVDPLGKIEIDLTDTGSGAVLSYYGAAAQPEFRGVTGRGTRAIPTATQLDDSLFLLSGTGINASGAKTIRRAYVALCASEHFTDSAQGTHIVFATTAIETMSRTEKVRISGAGSLLVGATAQVRNELLSINGPDVTHAGIYFNDRVPTDTTVTLYRSGNDLYWGATKLN